MKKIVAILLLLTLFICPTSFVAIASDSDDINGSGTNNGAESEDVDVENLALNSKSAILIEASTGEILYSKNASEALPPASVTKIMTLLLIAEAIDNQSIKLSDEVSVSANASSLGGSQIFLKEGERFTVEELLKSTVIASANDAAVALAEYIAGTESNFVGMMNKRASELGMKSSSFENATGLDDTTVNHVTSAYDIALMSRELIKHDIILKYSGLWQDSIRDGEFILTNTNRLVRFYPGCTGLKTGSTDKAGFCVSATAKRDGMHLIAVVMGAPTRDSRNLDARALLDYGFATYALYEDKMPTTKRIEVLKGHLDEVTVEAVGFSKLVKKSELSRIEKQDVIPESIEGGHSIGEKVGTSIYYINSVEIGRCDILLLDEIRKLHLFDVFWRIFVGCLS